jgi:hypothetical protein
VYTNGFKKLQKKSTGSWTRAKAPQISSARASIPKVPPMRNQWFITVDGTLAVFLIAILRPTFGPGFPILNRPFAN